MDARDALLAVACVTAFLVFLGPLHVYMLNFAILQAKSVVRYTPYSYLFTLVFSRLWAVYAGDWGLVPLFWVSLMGVLFGAAYFFMFLSCSDPSDPRLAKLFHFAAGGLALFIGAGVYDTFVPKSTIYGMICCAAACVASAAPLYNVPRAFRENGMDCMPSIFIPSFAFPNAIFWTVQNITLKGVRWSELDYNLVVSTGFAALCSLVQLVMHAWFMRPPPPPRTGLEQPFIGEEVGAAEAGLSPSTTTASAAPAAAAALAVDQPPQFIDLLEGNVDVPEA